MKNSTNPKRYVLSKYFYLPNPGLRVYFSRTNIGNPEDYRTPLFDKRPREDILQEWSYIYQQCSKQLNYQGLDDFENEMRSKVGPLSYQLPLVDRIDQIKEYFTPIHNSVPIKYDAIMDTVRYFRSIMGLRLKSANETLNDMRLNTNSGNPF